MTTLAVSLWISRTKILVLICVLPPGLCGPLKLLLSEGNPADTMLEDHGGTPLHAAASGGQDEAMKILLEHGADVIC